MENADNSTRCPWCGTDPLYTAYHDHEWGRPERDPRRLFELLILESFQAGLSWITILRKRDGFRAAFQGFDPAVIATWGEPEVARLLQDPGIVRHRGKIEGTIRGAQAFLRIEAREGFSPFLWSFAPPPAARPAGSRRCSRPDPAIPGHVQGPEARGLQLRRPDHHLCLHAGLRHGQRPSRHLPLGLTPWPFRPAPPYKGKHPTGVRHAGTGRNAAS
jgi:DNA-3-methyladenine glycosylase I